LIGAMQLPWNTADYADFEREADVVAPDARRFPNRKAARQ
jgi:hypothetical protein